MDYYSNAGKDTTNSIVKLEHYILFVLWLLWHLNFYLFIIFIFVQVTKSIKVLTCMWNEMVKTHAIVWYNIWYEPWFNEHWLNYITKCNIIFVSYCKLISEKGGFSFNKKKVKENWARHLDTKQNKNKLNKIFYMKVWQFNTKYLLALEDLYRMRKKNSNYFANIKMCVLITWKAKFIDESECQNWNQPNEYLLNS